MRKKISGHSLHKKKGLEEEYGKQLNRWEEGDELLVKYDCLATAMTTISCAGILIYGILIYFFPSLSHRQFPLNFDGMSFGGF